MPLPLELLLAELPPGVRAEIDTTVFAGPDQVEADELRRLADATDSHLVSYDLRVGAQGRHLCRTVVQADLSGDGIAALQAAERELPPWISLVAYARPAELRV